MKKYIAYLRVSSSSQVFKTQREVVLPYCKSNGMEFILFEEKESTRNTRPVKAEVMRLLRSGEYAGVIVYKLDRWARNTSELLLDMEEFISKGIELISIRDNLNLNSAMGRLQFHIISMFCQFERDIITTRIKDGLDRVKKTKKLGRPVGSKDTKPRKTEGYIKRELKKKLERMEQTIIPSNNSELENGDLGAV